MKYELLTVRVQTKTKARSVEKLPDGTFLVRTNVAPDKGKANKDVHKLLADFLNIPTSTLELWKGHTSSQKIFKKWL